MFLVPFEPRHAVLTWHGLHFTALEIVAAVAILALLSAPSRPRRRVTAPLLFLFAYAAAHALSAACALEHRDLAFKFALRMAAMALFGLAISRLEWAAQERGLRALRASTLVVASLAVLEATGWRTLDPFLGLFREAPVVVGGWRRATAGSEYPNQAALFLAYGLVLVSATFARGDRAWRRVVGPALLVSVGLLVTYSRGGLLAALCGLIVLALSLRRSAVLRSGATVSIAVLLSTAALFALGTRAFRMRLQPTSARWYDARYEPRETQFTLQPGEARVTEVRVTNTGIQSWSPDAGFALSYHWYDPERHDLVDGDRVPLPHAVEPQQAVVLRPEIRARPREGRYALVWDMVQVRERPIWFSGQGVRPAVATAWVSSRITVDDGRAAALSPPSLAWTPTRGELWSLALKLWRSRPWVGVGPDNFRWLYGRAAGRLTWDTRLFANNTLLEVAATTGVVGLAAMVGLLVSLGVHAKRALQRTERAGESGGSEYARWSVLLALLVVFVVQGTMDYVLAFTGHYLVFAFIVGAMSVDP